MALTDSFPTQDPGGLTITDTRLVFAGLVAQNADGTPRVGVFPYSTAPLVTGNAGMTYQIGPFKAVASRTGTGVDLVANDASTPVTTDPAPGSNSRIDVIWFQPRYAQHTDPANTPIFGVTKGTAAPSPTKPTIPPGALELAQATILSSTLATNTAVITQTAQFSAAAGGIAWLRSAADTWNAPDNALAWRADTKTLMLRSGGAWASTNKRVRRVAGTASGSLSGSSWLNLGPQQTIPAAPFGTDVPYSISVLAVSNATLSNNTYALRVLIDGATNAQTQVAGTGGISLDAEAQQSIATPNVTHTVDVQILSVTGASTVSTGSTISYFIIELERADSF